MILGKIWRSIKAQFNKLGNFFWSADPIAQLQYEYDLAVEQIKGGREGLEQYRALVDRVTRQVDTNRTQVATIEARVKAYLNAGDRETAAKFALDLQKAKKNLQENEAQLQLHESAYNNHLEKIKHASHKLGQLRDKIKKYDADLKMSRAEAELAKVAQTINIDVTTDFGQIEQVIQDRIDQNRAKAKVAADLSGEGIEEVKREQAMEKVLADQALRDFEVEMGLVTPETGKVAGTAKELGPATPAKEVTRQK